MVQCERWTGPESTAGAKVLKTLGERTARVARRYANRVFSRKAFQAPLAPRLSIETTSICNAKCGFCANQVMTRKRQPIPMEIFEKAVDDFVEMGGTTLDFNVTIGDPLLDPRLLERAAYVRHHPQLVWLGFHTTLQWLHLFDLEKFLAAGFSWVAVSTTLTGREKYLEFFGVDKYDQMLGNLVRLLEANQANRRLDIFIDPKTTGESKDEVRGHADYRMIRGLYGSDLDRQLDEQSVFVDDWGGAVRLPAFLRKRPVYPRSFLPCRLLYSGVIVYSNGNVGACACRDYDANSELILGRISDQTLSEMWNGERLAAIRSNWRRRNDVPAICRSCRHYVY
jgi:radical SAM protein with 4Fe4S-binding SPASM domain